MAQERDPNINARRLGLYLQRVREFVGGSYGEVALAVGCEVDWLVRVETGFGRPTPEEVEGLLVAYGVREANVAEIMIDLASRPDGPEWLAAHEERFRRGQRDVLISESEASVVRTFGSLLVPYLARSEVYFRCTEPQLHPDNDVELEWDLLSNRQRYRPGGRRRELQVIIDERVLDPRGEEEMMEAQLRHLLELGAGPDTTVHVIPKEAAFYEERAHPFDVLEFPGVADHISIAHMPHGSEITPYDLTDIWHFIKDKSALSPSDSRDLIVDHLAGRRRV